MKMLILLSLTVSSCGRPAERRDSRDSQYQDTETAIDADADG